MAQAYKYSHQENCEGHQGFKVQKKAVISPSQSPYHPLTSPPNSQLKSTSMMMNFCKNTLHSFLGIPHNHRDTLLPPPSTTTNGLNTITEHHHKPTNIIESASVKPSTSTTATMEKDSSGGSGGSLREITSSTGSSLLNSCTESLGLESSEQMEEEDIVVGKSNTVPESKIKRKSRIREDTKKFPPILSSLRTGECKTSFLKPVRENGRLILTEVTINRPEVFRASRQDGRLRLQLIKPEEKSKKLLTEKEEHRQWPVKSGGGSEEGLRRCNEQNHHNHHLHHHQRNRNQLQMPLWNQQCVTSR